MKDQLPTWSRRVNLFREASEANLLLIQRGKKLYQVFQRAPCSIQFPDHQGISWPRIGQCFI
jgi:hypothetical protein